MAVRIEQLDIGSGEKLAYLRQSGHRPEAAGAAPETIFLCGFRSDMSGTKATTLAEHAAARGRAFTRFDYRGHGQSTGAFEDGSIGDWLADTLAVIDRVTEGPLVVVGSSMGGWLALLTAIARPECVAGLVLVAPAPDFTERLVRPGLTPEQATTLARAGVVYLPSDYGEPLPVTARLLDEGRAHLLLDRPLSIRCPVHILHGRQDPDVPLSLSLELVGRLEHAPVTLEIIEDGDHRLSRDTDLQRLTTAVDRVVGLLTNSR